MEKEREDFITGFRLGHGWPQLGIYHLSLLKL